MIVNSRSNDNSKDSSEGCALNSTKSSQSSGPYILVLMIVFLGRISQQSQCGDGLQGQKFERSTKGHCQLRSWQGA